MSTMTAPCRICGALSTDPEWCSRCGANLSQPLQAQWLEVGARILFKDLQGDSPPADPPAAPQPSASKPIADAPAEDPPVDPPTDLPVAPAAIALVDPFELIGGPAPQEVAPDAAPDAANNTTASAPEPANPIPDAQADTQADALTDMLVEAPSPTVDLPAVPAGGGTWVEVTAPKAAYNKRRLWHAESLPDGRRFILEERQGAPSAELSLDPISEQFLLPIAARQTEGTRTLTLRPVPKGVNLQQWRDDTFPPPTPEQVYKVFGHLLAALEAIHAAGFLHLHLTPDQTWVSDDGVVTFTELDRFEKQPLSGKEQFKARLGYSAPELFGHGRQTAEARSDIYSLGAVLYYLIAGRRPPVSADTGFSPALPPRDFRPDFPVGLSDIVLVSMAPAPAHRFGSVAELGEAVRAGVQQMRERAAYRAPLRLEAYVERHIGFAKAKRSPVNQDQVFLGQDPQRDRLLAVVADGVSTATYGSGDLASSFIAKRAIEAWDKLDLSPIDPDPRAFIAEIIRLANRDVSDYINQHHGPLDAPPSEVMGSTALIAYISQGQMTLGSLGDSRCYLIRDDVMECLTRDHNLFTLSLIEGLSLEHALVMPHGDALARCLGTFDVDRHGVLLPQDPPIDLYTLRLIPGDHVLLCTDGLFDYAGASYEESEENIRQRVLCEEHPGIACLELILMANRGGGGDNIGLALIKVSET